MSIADDFTTLRRFITTTLQAPGSGVVEIEPGEVDGAFTDCLDRIEAENKKLDKLVSNLTELVDRLHEDLTREAQRLEDSRETLSNLRDREACAQVRIRPGVKIVHLNGEPLP